MPSCTVPEFIPSHLYCTKVGLLGVFRMIFRRPSEQVWMTFHCILMVIHFDAIKYTDQIGPQLYGSQNSGKYTFHFWLSTHHLTFDFSSTLPYMLQWFWKISISYFHLHLSAFVVSLLFLVKNLHDEPLRKGITFDKNFYYSFQWHYSPFFFTIYYSRCCMVALQPCHCHYIPLLLLSQTLA